MGLTNSTLGAAFIGSYVNTALYGALCVQSLEFFRRFKDDRRSLNYSVLFIWIINTVRVALQGHMIYKHLLVNGFEDKIVASDVPWSAITSCLLTFISSTFIQSHYCYRVWKMSGCDRRIITPLMLAMVTSLAFGIAIITKIFMRPEIPQFAYRHWVFCAALGSLTFTDLYIAVALCWLLLQGQKGGILRTQRIIKILLIYILSTGLLTSIIAIASVITCVTMPTNFIFAGIFFTIGGLYSNSFLASLNARDNLRKTSAALALDVPGPMLNLVRLRGGTSVATDDTRFTEQPSTSPSGLPKEKVENPV